PHQRRIRMQHCTGNRRRRITRDRTRRTRRYRDFGYGQRQHHTMTPSDQLRILVTRPAIQAEQLCDALRSAGAIPVLLPLINIVPHLESKRSEAWNKIAVYDWIVFSSANGVAYCWSQLITQQQDALRSHPKIAVVGPATAEAATN